VNGGHASKLAIQEKGDQPITAKRVAGSGLYKLRFSTSKGGTKKEEIEFKNTHIHTHTSVVDRECVRLERKLLNSLFCQESKVIDYVHRFN
jgi:hypothetical protein